ncbi:RICIN domain-containing protein [Actinoplanes sp. NPDC026619]|uniref:RICIN domain-containing protein n=1 Tax=Actinoplanes sp. NPDC026619 TaxID=3155798 RepID=UPI0033CB433D
MTSPEEDDTERPDPVLVRPYVNTTPAPRDPADALTVIQPAVVDDDTAIIDPVPAAPARRRGIGRILALRMLALFGALVLALAVAGILIFAPKHSTAQPSTALPVFTPGQPGSPAAAPAHRSASASPSSSSSAPSPSASASASISLSAPPPSAPTSASVTPTPPAADRTGAVTAASGRCLALGGLLGLDGSPITVSSCATIDYQTFTLATDGTLRVNGKCAQATGDGTVRIAACTGQASAQWRTAAAGALVNPATAQCLTDPGSPGATTKATACTGAANQTWHLP